MVVIIVIILIISLASTIPFKIHRKKAEEAFRKIDKECIVANKEFEQLCHPGRLFTDEVYWAAIDKANWIENYASMEEKRGQSDSIYQQQLLTM